MHFREKSLKTPYSYSVPGGGFLMVELLGNGWLFVMEMQKTHLKHCFFDS